MVEFGVKHLTMQNIYTKNMLVMEQIPILLGFLERMEI
jgi:hypothetical protein